MDIAEETRARPPARGEHPPAGVQELSERLAVDRQLAALVEQPCKSLGGRRLGEDRPFAGRSDLPLRECEDARQQGLQLVIGQIQRGSAMVSLTHHPGSTREGGAVVNLSARRVWMGLALLAAVAVVVVLIITSGGARGGGGGGGGY